jgi:glutathione S-transferase
MTPPHLLHFRVSHYNEKVRWALDFKGWPHVREALVPGFHIPRVRWLTGQNKVPVLVLDGEAIAGSSVILEAIEARRPEPPLFPGDPSERERALAIQAYFDDEVAPDLRRIFWSHYFERPADCARMATDGFSPAVRVVWRALWPLLRFPFRRNMKASPAQVGAARARMMGHFDRLASEIGPSGYLVGDRFGVADLTAAAVMTAVLRPPEFPYPIPEPWPPALAELRASVADHAASKWVRDIYARHRGKSSEVAPLAKA